MSFRDSIQFTAVFGWLIITRGFRRAGAWLRRKPYRPATWEYQAGTVPAQMLAGDAEGEASE